MDNEIKVNEIVRRFGARKLERQLRELEEGGYVTLTDLGRGLYEAAKRIAATPFGDGLTPEAHAVAERLRRWRSEEARKLGLSPFLILWNQVLYRLAEQSPKSIEDLVALGVRKKLIAERGEELLALIHPDREQQTAA